VYSVLTQKVKIGVIGCGVAATRDVLPNLVYPEIRKKGIELVAVCDTVEARAKQAKSTFGAKEAYTNYKEMLAKSDIDAVAILTPISLHFPIALDAVMAGKHVYVQKSMTTTLKEADILLSTVKKQDVKLVASPGQMHNPSLKMAKDMVDARMIGRPLWGFILSSSEGHIRESTDPSWYYKPGGGPVYSLLVYSVTTFCWILGSVKNVTALSGIAIPTRWWRQKPIDNEMDDSTMIIMDFGGSTFVSAISNFCSRGVTLKSEIYGDRGIISIPLDAFRSTQQSYRRVMIYNALRDLRMRLNLRKARMNQWIEWTPPLFEPPYPLAVTWGSHIIADILEFTRCIIDDTEPTVATGNRARHVIEIFEKAYESAKTGKAQKIETAFN